MSYNKPSLGGLICPYVDTTDQQMVSGYRASVASFRPFSFASPPFDGFAMSILRWQLAALRDYSRLGPLALRRRLSTGLRGASMSEFTSQRIYTI